jgi:DNA primase
LAQRFHDDAKEQVRQAANLVDLVSTYIPLKRSGRNFMACCPFHQEKTPSFSVRDDIQRWKCFGCGKSGDVFGFVMEREGISFPEALRMLAEQHGIAVGPADPGAREVQRAKEAARAAAEFACTWFQGHLKHLFPGPSQGREGFRVPQGAPPHR